MWTCPVCGYSRLPFEPKDFHICPSCGTEFGTDDFDTSHMELRHRWIFRGAPWFSRATRPPAGWSPFEQLFLADLVQVKFRGSEVEFVPTGSQCYGPEPIGRFTYSFRAA
mgnify:CR=1 FL=1